MKKLLLLFALSATLFQASAQSRSNDNNSGDDEEIEITEEEDEDEDPFSGISIGINIGSYFASKKTANIYNGTCQVGDLNRPDGVRCYTIAERIDPNLFLQTFQQITQEIGATNVEVPFDAYPANMRYSPAFNVGMQIKYNWGKDHAVVFNFNTVKLKAVDVFTLRFVGTGAQQNAQQDIRTFTISGTEQRFNVNLGYRGGVFINDGMNWYYQLGASMLGTQVEKNQIFIEGNAYDLFLGAQNPNQFVTLNNSPTGVGFGGYGALGLEFFIKEKYTFDISFMTSRDTMKMFNYSTTGWNKTFMASFTL